MLALVALVLAWRIREPHGMIFAPSVSRAAIREGLGEIFRLPMALGAIVFGSVAHALGYGVMWSALTLLLAIGFGASVRFRLSP